MPADSGTAAAPRVRLLYVLLAQQTGAFDAFVSCTATY